MIALGSGLAMSVRVYLLSVWVWISFLRCGGLPVGQIGMLTTEKYGAVTPEQITTYRPASFDEEAAVTGVVTLLDPAVRPFFSVLLHNIKKMLNDSNSANGTSLSTNEDNLALDGINHVRFEASRTSEVKQQLGLLKNATPYEDDGGLGSIGSVLIRPLDVTSPDKNQEVSDGLSNCSNVAAIEPYDNVDRREVRQTMILPLDCNYWNTQSWIRNHMSNTIYFNLQPLSNVSHYCIQSANLHIHFTGLPPSQFTRDDRMILLLAINKRTGGKRQQKIIDYRHVDSAMPVNITIDITNQVTRWMRAPSRNKGLSLSLRSSYGLDQQVNSFIGTSGDDCPLDDENELLNSSDFVDSIVPITNIQTWPDYEDENLVELTGNDNITNSEAGQNTTTQVNSVGIQRSTAAALGGNRTTPIPVDYLMDAFSSGDRESNEIGMGHRHIYLSVRYKTYTNTEQTVSNVTTTPLSTASLTYSLLSKPRGDRAVKTIPSLIQSHLTTPTSHQYRTQFMSDTPKYQTTPASHHTQFTSGTPKYLQLKLSVTKTVGGEGR